MKAIAFFLFVFLCFTTCKKDPPMLNEKIDGAWQVIYSQRYGSDVSYFIDSGLSFENTGENKGIINWSDKSYSPPVTDTAVGNYYNLSETAGTFQVNWKKSSFSGLTKSKSVGIRLIQDTLILTYPDTANVGLPRFYIDTIRVVR